MYIIMYFATQMCLWELGIMYSLYFYASKYYPILQNDLYRNICLGIIIVLWFINFVLLHLIAFKRFMKTLYICIYPIIFLAKIFIKIIKGEKLWVRVKL